MYCEKWRPVAEMCLFLEDLREGSRILCLCSRAFVEYVGHGPLPVVPDLWGLQTRGDGALEPRPARPTFGYRDAYEKGENVVPGGCYFPLAT